MKYSITYETKKKGMSRTSVAAGIIQTFLPSGGPIQAEPNSKETISAMGLRQFWMVLLLAINPNMPSSRTNISSHARGIPTTVEATFEAALDLIASQVFNCSHFL